MNKQPWQGMTDPLEAEDALHQHIVSLIEENRESFAMYYRYGDGRGGGLLELIRRIIGEPSQFDEAPSPYRKKIPQSIRKQVHEKHEYRCVVCGGYENLSIDHIVPVSLGGTDDIDNLQTMCMPCNASKGARVEGA